MYVYLHLHIVCIFLKPIENKGIKILNYGLCAPSTCTNAKFIDPVKPYSFIRKLSVGRAQRAR